MGVVVNMWRNGPEGEVTLCSSTLALEMVNEERILYLRRQGNLCSCFKTRRSCGSLTLPLGAITTCRDVDAMHNSTSTY